MSDGDFLFFKSVILNAVTLGFFFWAAVRLERGPVKNSFLIMLGLIFLFTNGINLFQYPGLSEDQAGLVSKIIFAAAISMNGAFGHFLLTFCAPLERRHVRYWLFQANMVILTLLSFSDLLSAGVRPGPSGLVPVYGPLHRYAAVSIALCDVYIFWAIVRQYRRLSDEVLKYQIQGVSWASLATFLAIITTNALVPAFFGSSELSRASSFWLLFYFTGLLHIIANGRTMFLQKSFRRLLKECAKISDENLWALRRLLHSVDQIVHEKPEVFEHRIAFTGAGQEPVDVNLSRGTAAADADRIDLRQGMPQKWFRGLLENLYQLETDNKRLAFSVLRAGAILDHPAEPYALPKRPGSYLPCTALADYREIIRDNLAENRRVFGQDLLCFSPELFAVLNRLQTYARSDQAVVFEGETGVGKTLLARALHHLRGGGPLIELSCMTATVSQLRERIQEFLDSPGPGRPGLLLRHLDGLAEEAFPLLEPVLDESRSASVFLTAQPDFLLHPPEMPARLLFRLKQLSIAIPGLRLRPDDVYKQFLYFADECNRACNLEYNEVRASATEEALGYSWPGNSRELKFATERALLTGNPPVLETLRLEQTLALPGVKEGLTPLEDSERDVIVKYLKKNNFNKSKTRRDLGITINTLNSKMVRYGIQARKK